MNPPGFRVPHRLPIFQIAIKRIDYYVVRREARSNLYIIGFGEPDRDQSPGHDPAIYHLYGGLLQILGGQSA